MKNEFVYVLFEIIPYEGSSIIDIYSDEVRANKKRDKIVKSHNKYDDDYDKWIKITNNEPDENKWPDFIETPEYYGSNIRVLKYKVL